MVFVDRMQFLLIATVDFRRQRGDGPEQFAHQITDHQQQDGQQNEEWQDTAPGTGTGVLVAGAGFLGDGDALAPGGGLDQDAKGFAGNGHGRQAVGQGRGEGQRRAGIIVPEALLPSARY